MTKRHDQKGDETIALRVPEKIAAALNAEALWKGLTKSELMRQILEERYSDGKAANVSGKEESFANNSADLEMALRDAALAMRQLIVASDKLRKQKSA